MTKQKQLINCIAIPAALMSFRLAGDDSIGRKNLQVSQLSIVFITCICIYIYIIMLYVFVFFNAAGIAGIVYTHTRAICRAHLFPFPFIFFLSQLDWLEDHPNL